MIEKQFTVQVSEPDYHPQLSALGPGEVNIQRLERIHGVYGGLRFKGFTEPAASFFLSMVRATVETLMRMADAHTMADGAKAEAAAHVFFEELYLRLESSSIPKHVCERLHLTTERQVLSGDYWITVKVTMAGQEGWSRIELVKDFPSERMVNDILMLA